MTNEMTDTAVATNVAVNEPGLVALQHAWALRSRAWEVLRDIRSTGNTALLDIIAIADALWDSGVIATSVRSEVVRMAEADCAE